MLFYGIPGTTDDNLCVSTSEFVERPYVGLTASSSAAWRKAAKNDDLRTQEAKQSKTPVARQPARVD